MNISISAYATFNITRGFYYGFQVYANSPNCYNSMNSSTNIGNFSTSIRANCIIWGPINENMTLNVQTFGYVYDSYYIQDATVTKISYD